MEGIFPSNMGGNMNAVKEDVEKSRSEKVCEIARHYGYDAQSRQCIEEMAELTQAINKYWRTELQCGKNLCNPWDGYMPDNSEEYYNLVEEIADVQIMLEQMKYFLGIQDRYYNVDINAKLNRQLNRIKTDTINRT